MSWQLEPGFNLFEHSISKLLNEYQLANIQLGNKQKLELQIIDGCLHWNFTKPDSNILLTNNYLLPGTLDSSRYEKFPNSWYGMYAGSVPIETVQPIKKYNCFINRLGNLDNLGCTN